MFTVFFAFYSPRRFFYDARRVTFRRFLNKMTLTNYTSEIFMKLNDITVGQTAFVCSLEQNGAMRRRLLDLGFTENAAVRCIGRSPFGDPSAFLVRGAVIALRSADAATVSVRTDELWS